MRLDPWRERWQTGQTGFHEAAPNALLVEHASALAGRARVLVPLCGKSNDLTFLRAQGHEVVGVEGVAMAAEAYFAERGVTPDERERDGVRWLSHDRVSIAIADYFEVALPRCDAVYDRGAMVAIEPELRGRYVEQTLAALSRPATLLIVAFTYDQAEMQGPPFSVDEAGLRALYGASARIERSVARDALAENPRFGERGARAIEESVFRIELA